MRIVDIPVEPLVAEAFKPFGVVIEGGGNKAEFENSPNRMINLGFEVDGRAELYIIRYLRQEMLISRLEQHLTMTEARVSLGEPVVVVVAESVALADPKAIPDPKTARAFLVMGRQGFMFNRGAWHSLDCYPTVASFADFAFFTEREAEKELTQLQDLDPDQCRRSHIVDFTRDHDLVFRVTDPIGLLNPETR